MSRISSRRVAVLLCSALLLTSIVVPAFGGSNVLSLAKSALRTAMSAKKSAKKAIRLARQNQTGPTGPVGARGEAGPVGPQGERGPTGADGKNGAIGPTGPAGVDGTPGATGATGPTGPRGPDIDGATLIRVRGDGTPSENGQALRDAMASITDASATKPYVIELSPGIFALGSAPLAVKDNVSLMGVGDASHITSTLVDNNIANAGLTIAGNSSLIDLRVSNVGTGTGFQQNGIATSGNVVLQDVTVRATTSASANFGNAIRVNGGTLLAEGVDSLGGATAANYTDGLLVTNGVVTVRNSVLASDHPSGYGALGIGTSLKIERSTLRGNTAVSAGTVATSMIAGGAVSSTCIFSYKADFTATNGTCG